MESSTLRRWADRSTTLLPPRLRAAIKRRYHARGSRRRLRTERGRWPPRTARVRAVDPHPALAALVDEPSARRPPDVCFVPPGPLDPVLDTLLRCEQDGVPVAALVTDAAGLGSEVARCVAVLVVADLRLRAAALAVVPDDRVVVWDLTAPSDRHTRLGPVLDALGIHVVTPRHG